MPIKLENLLESEDCGLNVFGDVSEQEHFPYIKVKLSSRIILNFTKAGRLSEQGLVHWSEWIRSFDSRQQFVFRAVPARWMEIFQRTQGALPIDLVVESLYIPYVCDHCGAEENWLAVRGKHFVESHSGKTSRTIFPDSFNCEKCKGLMKFGPWEEKFLKFLDD